MKTVLKAIDRLRAIVGGGDHIITDSDRLGDFSHDATFIESRPDFVVRPGTTEEVARISAVLYEHNIPITARGGGSGLSGGAVPLEGGAVVALDRLTTLDIHRSSMSAVVGAGVITADLKNSAEAQGLMYPPDPASIEMCTIGGNIATNAGGPSCLKYGVTAEYVLGLTVVLGDGTLLVLGGRARKRSAGYRLAQLFVGSEGTLGIVTEATLRLIPQPKFRAAALIAFASVDAAATAVSAILAGGHLPAALELIDRSSLEYVSDLLPRGFPREAAAVILVEQDGPEESAPSGELDEIVEIARSCGATAITADLKGERRAEMWKARRSIGTRLLERRAYRLPEDIAVPIDRIPEMVSRITQIASELGVSTAIFGHAGDGNLHPSLIFDDRDPATLRRVGEAASRIFHAALAFGGTMSAEHGLGAVKKEFATEELGGAQIDLMKKIKTVLDPKGLLNPGKTFPSRASADASFLEALPGWLPG